MALSFFIGIHSVIMLRAEEAIKKKLNIKYVGAQRLIAEAKQNLSIANGDTATEEERFDEIVEEAGNIFEDDLTEQEQEQMRLPDKPVESDFVRKAREAAEKREQKWALEEQERQRLLANGGVAAATADSAAVAAAAAAATGDALPEQAVDEKVTVIQDDDKAYITETTTTLADGKTRTVRTVRTVKPVKVPIKEATSTGMTCACTIL
jgi:hypothetical protein